MKNASKVARNLYRCTLSHGDRISGFTVQCVSTCGSLGAVQTSPSGEPQEHELLRLPWLGIPGYSGRMFFCTHSFDNRGSSMPLGQSGCFWARLDASDGLGTLELLSFLNIGVVSFVL